MDAGEENASSGVGAWKTAAVGRQGGGRGVSLCTAHRTFCTPPADDSARSALLAVYCSGISPLTCGCNILRGCVQNGASGGQAATGPDRQAIARKHRAQVRPMGTMTSSRPTTFASLALPPTPALHCHFERGVSTVERGEQRNQGC